MKNLKVESVTRIYKEDCEYYLFYMIHNLNYDIFYVYSEDAQCIGDEYYTEIEDYHKMFFARKTVINSNWYALYDNSPKI